MAIGATVVSNATIIAKNIVIEVFAMLNMLIN